MADSRELFKEPVIHILAFYPTNTCGHRGPHAPKVPLIYYVSTFRGKGFDNVTFCLLIFSNKNMATYVHRGEKVLKISQKLFLRNI